MSPVYPPRPTEDLPVELTEREPFYGTEILLLHCSLGAPFADCTVGDEDARPYFPAEYEGGATLGAPHLAYRPAPLSSTVRSTVDGVYGTVYLFTGFSIQFVAVANIV